MPKFIVKTGPQAGQEIRFDGSQITFGRTEECDVMVADANVSRRHAMALMLQESVAVMDLGSSNGTFVNQIPISRCFLTDGDEVRIGDTVLVYSENLHDDGAANVTVPSPAPAPGDAASVVPMPGDRTQMFETLTEERSAEALKEVYLKLKSLYRSVQEMAAARDRKGVYEALARAALVSVAAERILILQHDPKGQWSRVFAHLSSRIDDKQAAIPPDNAVVQEAAKQRRLASLNVGTEGPSAIALPLCPESPTPAVLYVDRPASSSRRFTKDEIDWLCTASLQGSARIEQIEQVHALTHENALLRKSADGDLSVVVRDPQMREILAVTQRVAATDSTVMITGESGTGKELVARSIHRFSKRGLKPLVAVNCAALPETLLESELFGHEKGAFTGAVERKPGKFEQADGGTLFLDEIGDISLAAQAKLLRALQEGEVTRVGGTRTIKVDVRMIAATNKDLAEEVKAGRFRDDLFFRLKVIEMAIPPLRERREDISALADHFLRVLRQKIPTPVRAFAPATLEILMGYEFPGNVRELRNIVERGLVFATGEVLLPEHLPADVLRATAQRAPALLAEATGPNVVAATAGVSSLDTTGNPVSLEELERRHIEFTLKFAKGNKVRTASVLGISRTTLYEKLKQYNILPAGSADEPEAADV